MNQGTQGYSFTKKTEGRKSRDTISLSKICKIHNCLAKYLINLICFRGFQQKCDFQCILEDVSVTHIFIMQIFRAAEQATIIIKKLCLMRHL
jgi:hypothetical protein